MLLTVKEAVEQCKISKNELMKYNMKPIIKKVGKRVLYDKDKLELAINKRCKEQEQKDFMYNGEKVVFASQIANVHGKSQATIHDRLLKKILEEGKDYYFIERGKEHTVVGYKTNRISPRGLKMITKRGYLKMYRNELNEEWFKKIFNEDVNLDMYNYDIEFDEPITNRQYYRGVRYVTASDIAKEHGLTSQSVTRRFLLQRDSMKEGVDFIRIPAIKCMKLGLVSYRPHNGGIYIYTASGYKKMFECDFDATHFNNLFGKDKKQTPINIEETESSFPKNDVCSATLESNDKITTYGHDETEASAKMASMIAKLIHAELTGDDSIHELINVLVDEHKTFKDILEKQSAQLDIMQQILSVVLNNNPSDPEIVEEVEVKNEPENQKNDLKFSSPTTTKEWYDDINRLLTEIKGYSDLDKNVILSEAYKRLNGQYGICLEQYRKEYQGIVGKKPNMLSTICWVENEKNPITHGLLAGVMDSMLSEAKGNDKKLREIAMV